MKNLLRLEERNETLVARFGGAELIRTQEGRFANVVSVCEKIPAQLPLHRRAQTRR